MLSERQFARVQKQHHRMLRKNQYATLEDALKKLQKGVALLAISLVIFLAFYIVIVAYVYTTLFATP
ncbi:MAG: hypothetical protein FWD76_01315 [Firmicutes bacterium]|nr:hypothetical protein [Bacillota bacterium]